MIEDSIEDLDAVSSYLTQSSPFSHKAEPTDKPSSMLLYKKRSRNPTIDSQDFSFFSKFYFKSFGAFGFVLQYKDYENFDEILIEKTEFSSSIHFINIRNNIVLKRTSSKICSGRPQTTKERCTDLPFNRLHNITVVYYGSNVIIKINEKEVGVYESLLQQSLNKQTRKTFGLFSHTGSSALFKDLKLERISIPEEVQNLLFGRKVETLTLNEKSPEESNERTAAQSIRFKEYESSSSVEGIFIEYIKRHLININFIV